MKRRAGYMAAAIIVMSICVLLTGITVMSQSKETEHIDTEFYEELEEQYLDQVREVLQEAGYSNCGLTFTFSRDMDSDRTYSLQIHHKRLLDLEETEQDNILQKLRQIPFVTRVDTKLA